MDPSLCRVVLPFETCFIFYTNTGTNVAFQGRCHFGCKGGISCTKVSCKYVYKKLKYCIRMLCKLYYYILVCMTAHILCGLLSLRNPCLSPRTFLSLESKIILYTCERNILLKIYLCAKKFLVCFFRVSSVAYVYMIKCVIFNSMFGKLFFLQQTKSLKKYFCWF